jgi:hypothetical protein
MFGLEFPGGSCSERKEEKAFREALGNVASHALRGTNLELLDEFGEPVMRLRQQPALTSEWRLARIDTSNRRKARMKAPSTDDPRGLRATFFETGVLAGETGAGGYSASYLAGGSRIDVDNVAPNSDVCERRSRTPECALEARFLEFLDEVDTYVVRDGKLLLLDGSRPRLEFVPAQDVDEEPTS